MERVYRMRFVLWTWTVSQHFSKFFLSKNECATRLKFPKFLCWRDIHVLQGCSINLGHVTKTTMANLIEFLDNGFNEWRFKSQL